MAALRTWWLRCPPSSSSSSSPPWRAEASSFTSSSSSCCFDAFASTTRTTMPPPFISLQQQQQQQQQHSSRSSLLNCYQVSTMPSSSSFHSARMTRRNRSSELITAHACCSSEGLEEGAAAAAAAAAAASDQDDHPLVELPLFPLPNSVLFPGAIIPLQIFEFRHRIMMQTLLQTAGADGDPIRFGFVYTAGSKSAAGAAVGCMGEVVKQERLVDDRFFLTCKGKTRFRVVDIVRTKPYVVARVRWLEDRPLPPPPPSSCDDQVEAAGGLRRLAREVGSCMEDVIRLSDKLKGKKSPPAGAEAMKELTCCSRTAMELLLRRPAQFSFFVASAILDGRPKEQQALLEMDDASSRLKREKEALWSRLSYLAAAWAIEDAFEHSSSYNNFFDN